MFKRDRKNFTIEDGLLVTYYPISFNDKSINKIKKCIEDSYLTISGVYIENGELKFALKESFVNEMEAKEKTTTAEIMNMMREESTGNSLQKNIELLPYGFDVNEDLKSHGLDTDDLCIYVDCLYNPEPELRVKSRKKESALEELVYIQNTLFSSRQMYGVSQGDFVVSYLLNPFYVKLCNDEIVLANISLNLYINNLAIVTVKIPLKNIDAELLYSSNIDECISEIKLPANKFDTTEEFKNVTDLNIPAGVGTIRRIVHIYIESIKGRKRIETLGFDCFHNVMLARYSEQTNSLKDASNNLKRFIYKTLNTPVNDDRNHIEGVKEFYENAYWGNNNYRFYFSKRGGCLSIVSADLLKKIRKRFDSEICCTDNNLICNEAFRTINFDIDYAIHIFILKFSNMKATYWNTAYRSHNQQQITKNKFNYLKTENMILEMQERCYGSVSELISKMQELMPYYIKEDLLQRKIRNVESLIEFDKEKRINRQQLVISLIGLLVTIFIGLPMVKQTLITIKSIFSIGDIPYVTLEGFSFCIWIVTIALIIILSFGYKIISGIKHVALFFVHLPYSR